MKKYGSSLLILASILASMISSVPCHALVRELASCTTADGKYQVFVSDNEGTGFDRTSHVGATVLDSDGNTVAFYRAEEFHGVMSISFGRPTYQDVTTRGSDFLLEGPSTNYRHYSLRVKMNVNGHSGKISDDNLNCNIFGGEVLSNQ